MSGRVIRSTKPAPKPPPRPKPKAVPPPHKPNIPKRQPLNVEPINKANIQAVYTRQGWLMWGIIILCLVMGWFFNDRIREGVGWLRLEVNEREYARLGQDLCELPLLTSPDYTCTAGELNCFTIPQEKVLRQYEQQARGFNKWRAERCLPLMD